MALSMKYESENNGVKNISANGNGNEMAKKWQCENNRNEISMKIIMASKIEWQ
jgi:hypothetical protein